MARLLVMITGARKQQKQQQTTARRIKSLYRFCPMLPLLLFCFSCVVATAQGPLEKSNYNNKQNQSDPIRLLLTVSQSAFTEPIIRGFNESCHKQQQDSRVSCFVRRQLVQCPDIHAALEDLQTMLATDFYAGLEGLAVNTDCNTQPYTGFLKDLTQQKGLSLLTYGRDLPATETGRFAFVASDNGFMGRTVARLLRQLHPEGGTYAVVGHMKVRTEAFQAEIEKYNHFPGRAHWSAIVPVELENRDDFFQQDMEEYSRMNPTAIVALRQTPMRHANWTRLVDDHRHRNITYVGVDAADYQIEYLNRRYVQGLVGQLPYEIGSTIFHTLYQDVLLKRQQALPETIDPIRIPSDGHVKTNLVAYNIIPLELPSLQVDENLLDDLAWMGYIFFGIVALTGLYCIAWTVHNRAAFVVRAAQPIFLVMIAVGVIVMASSLVPLSYDDSDEKDADQSPTFKIAICMCVPWLAFTGFTVIFSALFAKTWRVNRLFHQNANGTSATQPRAQAASARDVLAPFAFLLTCNWAILLAWTMWDPLEYTRLEYAGTDYWNRVLATYGVCRSDRALYFLIPLAVLNFAGVVMSCWQAYQARHFKSEFSEATYIGLTVASLCQAFMTGIPVVVVVRDMPRAYYVVLSLTIFLLSMAVLGFIFGPKLLLHQEYISKSHAEQVHMIRQGFDRRHNQQLSSSFPKPEDSSEMDSNLDSRVRSMYGSSATQSEESMFGYRSEHARGNDLTMVSIPEYGEAAEEEGDVLSKESSEALTSTGHTASISDSSSTKEAARQIKILLDGLTEDDCLGPERLNKVQQLVAMLAPENKSPPENKDPPAAISPENQADNKSDSTPKGILAALTGKVDSGHIAKSPMAASHKAASKNSHLIPILSDLTESRVSEAETIHEGDKHD